MIEVDHIREQLEILEDETKTQNNSEVQEKIDLLNSAISWRECIKQLRETKKIGKELKSIDKDIRKLGKSENIEEAIEQLRLARQQLNKLDDSYKKEMAGINNKRKPALVRLLNMIFNITFVLGWAPFITGIVLCDFYLQSILPVTIIGSIWVGAFLAWKIIWLRVYCQQISITGIKLVEVVISKITTALFLIWGYYACLCYTFDCTVYAYLIPFLVILLIKFSGMIFYLFLQTKMFDAMENIIILFVSLIICTSLFLPLIDNWLIIWFIDCFLVSASLLLTVVVLKKVLLEKVSFSEFSSMLSFVVIVLLTIALSVFTIYEFCWLEGEKEQILFSSITSVYAAVLGGAITLGGVAWTIKDGNEKRQEELQRVENERKEEERKKYRPFVNVYAGHNLQGLNITSDIMVTKWLNNTEDISNKPTERLVVANNIRNCWFGNTDFCSFYVWGIKINSNMTNFDSIRYIKKEFYFPLNFTGPIYTEKPIENLSLILEDMLGGLYELKLDFSVNSMYQQIVISGNEPTIFIGEKKMEKTDE